jgi:hypothetical protein
MTEWSHIKSYFDGEDWVLKDEAEQRIAELKANQRTASNNELHVAITEKNKQITELEAELDNAREVHCRKIVQLVRAIDVLQARLDAVKECTRYRLSDDTLSGLALDSKGDLLLVKDVWAAVSDAHMPA